MRLIKNKKKKTRTTGCPVALLLLSSQLNEKNLHQCLSNGCYINRDEFEAGAISCDFGYIKIFIIFRLFFAFYPGEQNI